MSRSASFRFLARSWDLLTSRKPGAARADLHRFRPQMQPLEDRWLPSGITAVGADAGGLPEVRVFDAASGALKFDFFAYNPSFTGGVRVATGDVTGDHVSDIITSPGHGGGPHIRIWDGVTGQLVREFMAYNPAFTGGVFIAVGDINGDSRDDVITGPDVSGGPDVRVYDGNSASLIAQYIVYNPGFTGGVRVASGDLDGDHRDDIITGAGPGGGPHVRELRGIDGRELGSLFAYSPSFTGGIYVSSGDINGDGRDDVVTGAGEGGGPHVRGFSGRDDSLITEFFAYGTDTKHHDDDPLNDDDIYHSWDDGVRVGVVDRNGDGHDEIVTGTGPSHAPLQKVFDDHGNQLEDFSCYDEAYRGGIYVGGDG